MLHTIEIHDFKGLSDVSLSNCGKLNALVGKNNSGKSSVLHAIDMAGLALSVNDWNQFQPKLEIKDLFADIGTFSIGLKYKNGNTVTLTANSRYGPKFEPQPSRQEKFKSVLILPDVGSGMLQRRHKTPRDIISLVKNRNYSQVNSLDILYAIKFYSQHEQRGFTEEKYESILNEIKHYFPEIESVECSRTEDDIATLRYTEFGRELDILYSGTGLKHFLDVLLKTIVSEANIVLIDEPELGLHPDLQRRFIEYLDTLSEEKNIQFFMATHSPILLNYAECMEYYRVINLSGSRDIINVPNDAIHTLLSDIGIRPSDVFNRDICILVEGATDVVFFEHLIYGLYSEEFKDIAIGVIQYGGSAAEGIISGAINVGNISSAQEYTLWIRDRDAAPDESPSKNSTKFKNALEKEGLNAYILKKREIEFYFPKEVISEAQQGNSNKIKLALEILSGNQKEKFKNAAKEHEICVPEGKYLRNLLNKNLNKKNLLDKEIRELIEEKLITWKNEILGEI